MKSLGDRGFRVSETSERFIFASRGSVFFYSSYFILKGHSMAIGFSPNHRAGSKAVWTVLLTVKRPISCFVLVPGTIVSGLVMGPSVRGFYSLNMDCMVVGTEIGSQHIRDEKAPCEILISQTLRNLGWCARNFVWVAKFSLSQPSCEIGKLNFERS